MTKEDLFEAIGSIDDEALVLGDAVMSSERNTAGFFSKKAGAKTGRSSFMVKRWVAAAACFIVVVAGVIVVRGISSTWRMGSAKDAMQKSTQMAESEMETAYYDSNASYAASAEPDKAMTYGVLSEVDSLVTSNIAIQVESADRKTGQVELSEEMRGLVLGSLKQEEAIEEEAAADNGPENSIDVPEQTRAGGAQAPAEAGAPEESALFILTFEQSDVTYVATLYSNRALVFEDDALETIFLSEEEFERLVFSLQNAQPDQNQ